MKEAVRIASARRFPVVVVGNDTQNLQRLAEEGRVSIVEVPVGRDAADFSIATGVCAEDIVITDDIGLACMVLGRNATVLSSRGYQYDTKTIDFDLHLRHVGQKTRRSGGKTKGPRPFTSEDRNRFTSTLKRLIREVAAR